MNLKDLPETLHELRPQQVLCLEALSLEALKVEPHRRKPKGKINQSMAFGVPVVATSLGVEGTDLRDREDIIVADEPEEFARELVELYESRQLWNHLSENGIKKTRELYSVEAAREKLRFLFSEEHLNRVESSPAVAKQELAVTS